MSLQESTTVRNARLDQIETSVGVTPILRIYTGGVPANCGAASTGTKVLEITLPADWMNDASGGTKTQKGGPWTSTGLAAGTAGYWRIYELTGTTCHLQGTVGQGSGDMSLDNTNIAIGQTVNVNSFTLSAGNA